MRRSVAPATNRRGQPYLVSLSAFVEALQAIAAKGSLPAAWSRLPAALLHSAARGVSRGAITGGGTALDMRLAVLSMACAVLGALPTVFDLARMVASFQHIAGSDDSGRGVRFSAASDARLWFQDGSRGDGDLDASAASLLASTFLEMWASEEGRLDYAGMLLDLCHDPASGAAAPAALGQLCADGGVDANGPGPCAAVGLFKAFVVTSLLEGRLSSVPGAEGGALPVWEDVVISSQGFRALLQREADRGMAIDVDAIVQEHASPVDGSVSFHQLSAAQPAWLRATSVPIYTLGNFFKPLLGDA